MKMLAYFCVLAFCLSLVQCEEGDGEMFLKTIDALTRALNYMSRKISEVNLDAVFCIRQVQEQLQSYLTNQPEVFHDVNFRLSGLRDIAKGIADKGMELTYLDDPEFANHMGFMLKESKKVAWYPSLTTSDEYVVEAVNCSSYLYDELKELDCFHDIVGGSGKECDVKQSCIEYNEEKNQRSYGLTHQAIFWQKMEARKCVDSVPLERRMRICSNVLRDSKNAEAAGFPEFYLDLFLEQIGICGFWGFSDFNNPEWLELILEWQEDSGCFTHVPDEDRCLDTVKEERLDTVKEERLDTVTEETHTRVKRRERLLEDGCYSHETGVALLALVANVRFEAEKVYQRKLEQAPGLTADSGGIRPDFVLASSLFTTLASLIWRYIRIHNL